MTTPPRPLWAVPEPTTTKLRFVVTLEVPADLDERAVGEALDQVASDLHPEAHRTVVTTLIPGSFIAVLDLAIAAARQYPKDPNLHDCLADIAEQILNLLRAK